MSGLIQEAESLAFIRANHKIGDIVELEVLADFDCAKDSLKPRAIILASVPHDRLHPQETSLLKCFTTCQRPRDLGGEQEGFFFGMAARIHEQRFKRPPLKGNKSGQACAYLKNSGDYGSKLSSSASTKYSSSGSDSSSGDESAGSLQKRNSFEKERKKSFEEPTNIHYT